MNANQLTDDQRAEMKRLSDPERIANPTRKENAMDTTYLLVDTDTLETIATGATEAEVLSHSGYMPYDCLEGAETWQEVVEAATSHADGLLGLVDGYAVERHDSIRQACKLWGKSSTDTAFVVADDGRDEKGEREREAWLRNRRIREQT